MSSAAGSAGRRCVWRIRDHLHAVLGRSQRPVSIGKRAPVASSRWPPADQRLDRIEGRRRPDRGITAAVNHLLDLNEKLDFPDTAATPLEIEARSDNRALSEMIADACRNLPNFLDHSKIERAPPHERLNRIEKALAKHDVARAGPVLG